MPNPSHRKPDWSDTLPEERELLDRHGLTAGDRAWLVIVIAAACAVSLFLAFAASWRDAEFREEQACRERLAAQNATLTMQQRICGKRKEGLL